MKCEKNGAICLQCDLSAVFCRIVVSNELTDDRLSYILSDRKFRFTCTACGNCCKGPGEVYFTKQDLKNIIGYKQLNRTQAKELKSKLVQKESHGYFIHDTDEACILLENNRCSVYSVRPMQCRTFPFWPSTFRTKSGFKEVVKECPGTMSAHSKEFTNDQLRSRTAKTEKEFLKPQSSDPAEQIML